MSQEQQPAPINEKVSSIQIDKESQREIIDLLQVTIQQLKGIVDKLTTEAIQNLPSRAIVAALVANTEALEKSLESPEQESVLTEQEIKALSEQIETGEPTEPGATEHFYPKMRFTSPEPVQKTEIARPVQKTEITRQKSSFRDKRILIGILVTIVLVALLVGLRLFPKLQLADNFISNVPFLTETPNTKIIETPTEIESPGIPEPMEIAPPPPLELTPEQSLIAAIQAEITSLTRQYPDGLIASIEANFLASRLIVTMGDDWYQLNQSRKNNLANTILQKAQTLDFRKLELINKNGDLIARSPVVGKEMIILDRES